MQLKSTVEARERAEAALRDSEARLRTIIDCVDGVVWEADPGTFRFSYVSPKAEKILGYPVSRWLEEPTFWVEHIYPEDRDRAIRYCVEQTRAGRDHEFEYRMLAADGRIVWLRDLVAVAESAGTVRLRGIMVDITAQKHGEALLACQTKVLELIATGAPLTTSLATLLHTLEALSPDLIGSVLLLDEDGVHLRHGAAPSLPKPSRARGRRSTSTCLPSRRGCLRRQLRASCSPLRAVAPRPSCSSRTKKWCGRWRS